MAGTDTTDQGTQLDTNRTLTRAHGSQATVPSPLAPIDPNFQLVPESPPSRQTEVAVAPARSSAARRRPILVILPLLLLGAGSWWVVTADWKPQWTPPWVQPAGPLTASGTLEADEILIGAEVAGRILELVQEGQSLSADAVVAKLDDSQIQIQIRQGDLAARQRLEIQAARYQLRSPINGVVTRVPMHVGEVVSPGQTVVAVADLSQLKLTAYVLARDLGQVQIGQQVTVTVDPFPTRAFRGVVTGTNQRAEFTPRNVQTRADRLNLVFGVRIRVDNPDGALKPGMPADATFMP